MKRKQAPNETMRKEIRKAMIDADISFEQIGDATPSAWRKRISNMDRMTIGDFRYLCERLNVKMSDIIQ